MSDSACENGVEHARPPRSMRLSELVGRCLPAPTPIIGEDRLVNDICIDSRLAGPGSTFVAVRGTKLNGGEFIADATRRGAVAVISDQAVESSGPSLVRVPDARAMASKMAAALYGLTEAQANGYKITGVTGTNGKSTIAYMVRAILQAAGQRCGLLGTIHYDLVSRIEKAPLTTPDAVQLVRHLMTAHDAGAGFAALEVSSHSLDQHRTDGITFDVAIFSNLTQDHLDYHGDMESYFLAKRRLFDELRSGATAVVNYDDAYGRRVVENCKANVIGYGFKPGAKLRAELKNSGLNGSTFAVIDGARSDEFEIRLPGPHNIYNALAAIAATRALGISTDAIRLGLQRLAFVPGRLQRVGTDTNDPSIFVDYAHTDDALRNVLSSIRPLTPGKLWCVFGCGGDRDRGKRPKMAQAVETWADRFIITSDNPRTENPLAIIRDIEAGLNDQVSDRYSTEPDRAKAIRTAVMELEAGDALIIAGKGHEDYQIIGEERIHFDDVEVASAALRDR